MQLNKILTSLMLVVIELTALSALPLADSSQCGVGDGDAELRKYI